MDKTTRLGMGLAFLAFSGAEMAGASGLRVAGMGGMTLAIADESTKTDLYNYQNPAGLGFLEAKNRWDAVASFASEQTLIRSYEEEFVGFLKNQIDAQEIYTHNKLDLLNNPFDTYKGLYYWLAPNLVIHPQISAFVTGIEVASEQTVTTTDYSMIPNQISVSEKTVKSQQNAWGGSGSLAAAFAPDKNFAMGLEAGADLISTTPGSLPTGMAKQETSSLQIPLAVGLGWNVPGVFGKQQDLLLGLDLHTAGAADEQTFLEADNGSSTRTAQSSAPLRVGVQAFTTSEWLETGLNFSYTSANGKYRQEITGLEPVEFKNSTEHSAAIGPVFIMTYPFTSDITFRTGATLNSIVSLTDAFNATYKTSSTVATHFALACGHGMELLNKKLRLGAQGEWSMDRSEQENFSSTGDRLGDPVAIQGATFKVTAGGEYALQNNLDLRAGCGFYSEQPDLDQDYSITTTSLRAGLGYRMNKIVADLLAKLDLQSIDNEGKQTPLSNLGFYLGVAIPL
jgi:hypothetical protein